MEEKIPISRNLQSYLKKNNYKKSNFISNGDDYQILFTASTDKSRIIKNISKKLGVKYQELVKLDQTIKNHSLLMKKVSIYYLKTLVISTNFKS